MAQNDTMTRRIITALANETEEVRRRNERISDLKTTLRVMNEFEEPGEQPVPTTAPPPDNSQGEIPSLFALEIDVTGGMTQREIVKRIAVANGGVIHPNQTAQFMVAKGYSSGKVSPLRSHIISWCQDDKDYVHTGPDRFELVPENTILLTESGSESNCTLL